MLCHRIMTSIACAFNLLMLRRVVVQCSEAEYWGLHPKNEVRKRSIRGHVRILTQVIMSNKMSREYNFRSLEARHESDGESYCVCLLLPTFSSKSMATIACPLTRLIVFWDVWLLGMGSYPFQSSQMTTFHLFHLERLSHGAQNQMSSGRQ